jgi:hypothetical protein
MTPGGAISSLAILRFAGEGGGDALRSVGEGR